MKKGILWTVLAIAVVIVAVVLTVLLIDGQKDKQIGSQVVFSATIDEISEVKWNYNTEKLSFTNGEEGWYYTADKDFPLDVSLLEERLEELEEIISYNTIQNPRDPASYGLDDPICTIEVTANGVTSKVMIGDQSVAGSIYYLSTGDEKVHMVDGSLFEAFYCGLYDLIALEESPNLNNIWGIKVEGYYSMDLSCVWDDAGVRWHANVDGEKLALDFAKTEEFVANLQKIKLESCVCYNAEGDLLTQYGLGEKAVKVTVIRDQNDPEKTVVLELGYSLEEGTYIRLEGSKMIYMVDSRVCNVLRATEYTSLLQA